MNIIFVFLTVFVSHALCSEVLEFNDNNFEQKVAEHSIILVEFYAPWCGHCKRLSPEYEIAATTLKKSDPPLILAKVDCIAEIKTCEKHGINGYPSLKVFKNGQFAHDYDGEVTGEGIIKYMSSKSGPASREVISNEEISKIYKSHLPIVFGFFKVESSTLYIIFLNVADMLNEDLKFEHSFNEEVAKKLEIEEGIHIIYPKIMSSKFEKAIITYVGRKSSYELNTWIVKNIIGIAGIRTASNSKYFNERPIVIAYYNVDYENNPKGSNYWRNRILKVGTKFLNLNINIHFAISNSLQMSEELEEFGIQNPDALKIYITIRNSNNQKFKMAKNFSIKNLDTFITHFFASKLKPYLKSEAIPEKNNDAVKIVVAKTFDEIVNDPIKDVLIEFYAPSCDKCKILAPKLEELAKKLSNEPDVVISKMDTTLNDIPTNYDITDFPTIYFAPKYQKSSPKLYSGEKEVDDIFKFIAVESTSSLKNYNRNGKLVKLGL